MSKFKILWAITGSGYLIRESIDLMKELQENPNIDITVMLSKEGAVVVKWYRQWLYLKEVVKKVAIEKTPNNPFYAGPLQIGKYDIFITCPVSANSVAKIVYGIADTLITNCVAQSIKGGVTAYLLPSDQDLESITTTRPDGSPLTLKIRDIEIENVEKLRKMDGVIVLTDFSEIKILISDIIENFG
ncbi:MAG: archaeoflavoprotein AfpA [Candidatus Lokiarchaeota archaeon]|nr:archaeoflavoprotein AfpA [Candidatus Lokiarchaeota archaeon]